jgi:hypothetical protein
MRADRYFASSGLDRYVEDLNDARTTLEDFLNLLLIGVADAAPVNQLQKLQPGLRLTAEGAQH